MKMLPRIFGEDFFGDFMDPFGKYLPDVSYPKEKELPAIMKTDIEECDGKYEISMDLPGVSKDAIKVELEDGYLFVSASVTRDVRKSDPGRTYIRKERYNGQYKRSFYVGENVSKEQVTAEFKDGVLRLVVPKSDPSRPKTSNVIQVN